MAKRTSRIAGGIVLGLILLYLGLVLFVARTIVFPWWYKANVEPTGKLPACTDYQSRVYSYCHDPKQDLKLDFKEFKTLRTVEGRTIYTSGWWIFSPTSALKQRAVILVHGGGADRRAMLKHVPYLQRAGFHVFDIDCHNHGLNRRDGRGISLGLWESESVLSAVEWAAGQLDRGAAAGAPPEIIVFGTSQGAFAALKAAAKSSLIQTVIAENPYFSAERQIQEFPSFGWIPRSLRSSALFLLQFWWGHSVDELDIRIFADRLREKRVLLVHSRADRVTPVANSEDIYAAIKGSSGTQLWIVNNGEHEALLNELGSSYQRHVLDFLGVHVQD